MKGHAPPTRSARGLEEGLEVPLELLELELELELVLLVLLLLSLLLRAGSYGSGGRRPPP